ncbi:permease-like cell division protein FtsX [Aestuariimicrobium sp. p3-SID1156]|uniref:permease-like cell division protein FtsX n=1 Tax=Aestuariimicrobium sp. p3-SID1156 TaxID=2916038 RepID=UPI0021E3667B|nr:permease-like cell division protein FtsX [Aestuariimicrobium sp. p3-SID1156]MCT1459947.1 permease-like cell division protein FtsX [Aestuariimicrobium sp. p3-SID1156]
MRHTLRETWSGLRRNLTLTLSVIVTIWVSLTLFGAGLMAMQQVDLVKGRWYDKIEISIYLCNEVSTGGNCVPGQEVTQAQKDAIRKSLEANPEVEKVYFVSKAEAWDEYKEVFKNSPLLNDTGPADMQESFMVKLKNPEQYKGLVSEAQGLDGVQNIVDMHAVLDPIFRWLNALQWGTMLMSGLLLLAAALQIANSIRIAAFSRRRELGIMRLVGASNFYIMAPFLLESLVTGLLGAALACGTLALGFELIVRRNAQVSIQSLQWIGWSHAGIAMVAVAIIALLLSIIPTVLATRKYLRV